MSARLGLFMRARPREGLEEAIIVKQMHLYLFDRVDETMRRTWGSGWQEQCQACQDDWCCDSSINRPKNSG